MKRAENRATGIGWITLLLASVVVTGLGCGGQKSQPTTPGKIDPAAVQSHDAKVDEEEGRQRAMEEKQGP